MKRGQVQTTEWWKLGVKGKEERMMSEKRVEKEEGWESGFVCHKKV